MTEERNYEEEASAEGWVPQEEWKGDPERWKPAKDFVEAGENILPIVKSKMERFERELKDAKNANKEFSAFFKDFKQREEKEKEKLKEQLESLKKQAIQDGDGEAFIKAERELDELKQPASNEMTPIQMGWLEDNNWYGRDNRLTRDADLISDELRAEGYKDQSPAFFSELTRRVKEDYPDKFENPKRSKPNTVESVGEQVKIDSKAKTYDNLPKEAKAACDDFVKQGFMTKEDYVETFDWSEDNV